MCHRHGSRGDCACLRHAHDNAYAAIYQVSSEESASAQDDADDQNGASADKATNDEEIDDEENPMSSGLGGGEPVSGLGDTYLEWVIVVGIIAVAVFFGVSMWRQNTNINKMKRTVRFK